MVSTEGVLGVVAGRGSEVGCVKVPLPGSTGSRSGKSLSAWHRPMSAFSKRNGVSKYISLKRNKVAS